MEDKEKNVHAEPSAPKQWENGRKVKVAFIGTGGIADAHMRSYLKQPDVEIVAAADLIPGKAQAFMERHGVAGVRFYRNHKELLDAETDLDAVSVCTYNMQHAPCAIYALQKGVNVLLEKPMCVTQEEAVALLRAEKASGKILSVGFQPRFSEGLKLIKKVVESGTLGKVYYIQTGGGRRRGIPTPRGVTTFIEKETAGLGALGDIGCYSLDMVLNAIGYPKPLTVSGYTSAYFGTSPKYINPPEYANRFGVDDFAAAFVRLEGGIVLDFRIAWAMHPDTTGDTLLLGTEGALRIPSTECWNGELSRPLTLYHDMAGRQVETILPVPENKEKLFDPKIRSFLDAIRNGTPSPIPSSQILYNQAIISAIADSARLGHEVEIHIPEI